MKAGLRLQNTGRERQTGVNVSMPPLRRARRRRRVRPLLSLLSLLLALVKRNGRRSYALERRMRDATPIEDRGAVSPKKTPLRIHGAGFAKRDAAPRVWSSVCVSNSPLRRHGAGSCERNAALNAKSGDQLSKSPLDVCGAESLRQNTAPKGRSGVNMLILDRRPTVAAPHFPDYPSLLQ